jgi:flagellar biosynthetic protein FlhB
MSGEERTEKATPKRQQELRRKGATARSTELPAALSMLALVVALPMAARSLAERMSVGMTAGLSGAGRADLDTAAALARRLLADSARALVLPVLLVAAASVLSSAAVTRERPSLVFLRPKLAMLSPKNGIKRVLSAQGLVEFGKATAKLALMVLVGYSAWQAGATRLISSPASVEAALAAVAAASLALIAKVGGISLLVGAADALWARRRHGKQARMTKQEVKEEAKQSDGNPHTKAAIRGRQLRLSRSRMMAAIAGADVVLTNPTHLAVALRYDPESTAPVVVAKGAGVIAARIRAEAGKHDVPVLEDKPLARALYRGSDIGDVIPIELYRAVAEVLATVYAARRRRGLPPQRPPAPGRGRPAGPRTAAPRAAVPRTAGGTRP